MAPQPKQPNLYQLSGDGIHVTYTTTSITGQPQLTYQDAHETKHFMGDQIKVEETRAGMLVSVALRMTVDAGSTTFTLFIPRVTLRFSDSAPVHTIGLVTVHKVSIIGLPNGQDDFYTAHNLAGTASFVLF